MLLLFSTVKIDTYPKLNLTLQKTTNKKCIVSNLEEMVNLCLACEGLK